MESIKLKVFLKEKKFGKNENKKFIKHEMASFMGYDIYTKIMVRNLFFEG